MGRACAEECALELGWREGRPIELEDVCCVCECAAPEAELEPDERPVEPEGDMVRLLLDAAQDDALGRDEPTLFEVSDADRLNVLDREDL